MKGTEAQTYLEELSRTVPPSSGDRGASERDLLDQIVHLEKEVRSRDATISNLRERGVTSSGNEARFLREENEDLKVRHNLQNTRSNWNTISLCSLDFTCPSFLLLERGQ